MQRLVQRQDYELPETKQRVSEISIDGGKVRLRSELKGVESYWRDLHCCSIVRYLLWSILPR